MKAIWGKDLLQEKNIHLVFGYTYTPQAGDRLELAASNLYRLFVDGNLVGYGPARAAHGYSRLDTYSLSDWAGKPVTVSVEVYAFYFGVASPESHEALFERMRSVFGPRRNAKTVYPTVYPSNAIVGNYLRLEILLQRGFYQQVLQECKDFFTPMAQLTGTLWEHSRLSASLNHGFASVAALYIDRCVKACRHSEPFYAQI